MRKSKLFASLEAQVPVPEEGNADAAKEQPNPEGEVAEMQLPDGGVPPKDENEQVVPEGEQTNEDPNVAGGNEDLQNATDNGEGGAGPENAEGGDGEQPADDTPPPDMDVEGIEDTPLEGEGEGEEDPDLNADSEAADAADSQDEMLADQAQNKLTEENVNKITVTLECLSPCAVHAGEDPAVDHIVQSTMGEVQNQLGIDPAAELATENYKGSKSILTRSLESMLETTEQVNASLRKSYGQRVHEWISESIEQFEGIKARLRKRSEDLPSELAFMAEISGEKYKYLVSQDNEDPTISIKKAAMAVNLLFNIADKIKKSDDLANFDLKGEVSKYFKVTNESGTGVTFIANDNIGPKKIEFGLGVRDAKAISFFTEEDQKPKADVTITMDKDKAIGITAEAITAIDDTIARLKDVLAQTNFDSLMVSGLDVFYTHISTKIVPCALWTVDDLAQALES